MVWLLTGYMHLSPGPSTDKKNKTSRHTDSRAETVTTTQPYFVPQRKMIKWCSFIWPSWKKKLISLLALWLSLTDVRSSSQPAASQQRENLCVVRFDHVLPFCSLLVFYVSVGILAHVSSLELRRRIPGQVGSYAPADIPHWTRQVLWVPVRKKRSMYPVLICLDLKFWAWELQKTKKRQLLLQATRALEKLPSF